MKRLVILTGLCIFIGVGCLAQKEVWTGLYYTNGCKGCNEETVISLELNSFGDCQKWLEQTVEKNTSDNALFECGMNCVATGDGALSCASYENVDLASKAEKEIEPIQDNLQQNVESTKNEKDEIVEVEKETSESNSEELVKETEKEDTPPPRKVLTLEECNTLLPDNYDSDEYKLDCLSKNTDQDINLDDLPKKITIQPFKFTGSVDGTALKIVVYWKNGKRSDSYELKRFTKGDRTFWYSVSERFNNFAKGTNLYTFVSYFEDGTAVKQAEIEY